MKEISSLLGYREGVRVVDATLRDGGLVNSFRFSDEFVKALYTANIEAGVDYMEVGYKASKKMFDVQEFGKWKFTNDEDILKVIGENAEKIYERHTILTKCLIALGVSEETAAEDACKIEHDISDESFSAIKRHIIKN